jgi:exodeoxyribonuclease VII large subunit
MAVLDSLSPLKVLDRGFSMVMVDNKIITHSEDLKPGDTVSVRMCKGSIEAEVKKVNKER